MAVEGNDKVVECTSSGTPIPNVHWMKDNRLVTDDTLAFNALQLKSVEVEDSGMYICIASNVGGNATVSVQIVVHCTLTCLSPTIIVEILFCLYFLVAPRVTSSMKDTRVLAGGNITWSCKALANPTAVISWDKDGRNIVPSASVKVSDDGTELSLSNVQPPDSGFYHCVAKNYVAASYKSASLFVVGKFYVLLSHIIDFL